jgi:uncharacterized BrkB/YihY/UPF0761 family membrane protein
MCHRAMPFEFTRSRIRGSSSSGGVTFLLAIAVMLALLVYIWNYVGPSGQRMSPADFVLFNLRELIILGIAFVAAIFICFGWLWQRAVAWRKRNANSPS